MLEIIAIIFSITFIVMVFSVLSVIATKEKESERFAQLQRARANVNEFREILDEEISLLQKKGTLDLNRQSTGLSSPGGKISLEKIENDLTKIRSTISTNKREFAEIRRKF